MISLSNLTMHYGQKVLFENVTIQFDPGKRYGIVGANGSGKSTLLRVLCGEEKAVSGEISFPQEARLGVLQQNHFQYDTHRVIDVVLQGKPALWNALQEKEQLIAQGEIDEKRGQRLGELEEVIAHQEGYHAESFAAELLSGLGIVHFQHAGKMSALSGGFKLRVLLAQVLFKEPDVLLLDEPTNHLDILSIAWLEGFLKNSFTGTLLMVSHDRTFLDAVCTHVADIDFATIESYVGNYDQFIHAKMQVMDQKQKEFANQEKKKAELQAFVDRFRAKATKARQAQSRVKQIERIEMPEIRRSSRIAPVLKFTQQRSSGKEVLELKGISKTFGAKSVLKQVDFTLMRGDKVAIIGPNGVGKSTLLKIVMEDLKADAGTCQWGYETHASYFAQDHGAAFREQKSVYEWLYQFFPQETIGTIRGVLGQMLFSGEEVQKKVGALSGGESARLLFAKMMLAQGNVLIFDEPTNHLDLEGVEALENALRDFEGTLLFVTHDRRFVSKVATRILALSPEGMEDFSGSYGDYVEYFGEDYLDREEVNLRAKKNAKKAAPPKQTLTFAEKKELKRLAAQLSKKNGELEKIIERQENEMVAIDERFGGTDFYQKTPPEKIQALQQNKKKIAGQLAENLQLWEKSLSELEQVQSQLEQVN